MDHSIHGYLSRRHTAELAALLQYCLKEENDSHIISEILGILSEREEGLSH